MSPAETKTESGCKRLWGGFTEFFGSTKGAGVRAVKESLQREYLDLRALSVYACLPIPTLRDYIADCGLPIFRVRAKILVRRREFDQWMEGFRVKQDRLEDIVDEVLESVKSDRISVGHGA